MTSAIYSVYRGFTLSGYFSPSRSAYSEGATPKCLRKMVEKCAKLENPTV